MPISESLRSASLELERGCPAEALRILRAIDRTVRLSPVEHASLLAAEAACGGILGGLATIRGHFVNLSEVSVKVLRPGEGALLLASYLSLGVELAKLELKEQKLDRRGQAVQIVSATILSLGSWWERLGCSRVGEHEEYACAPDSFPVAQLDRLWCNVAAMEPSEPGIKLVVSTIVALARTAVTGLSLIGHYSEAQALLSLCERKGELSNELKTLAAAAAAVSGNQERALDILRKDSAGASTLVLQDHLAFAVENAFPEAARFLSASRGLALLSGSTQEASCALNLVGVRLAARGEYEAAAAQFQGALRADPSLLESAFNLGLLYFATGSAAEALEVFIFVLEERRTTSGSSAVPRQTLVAPSRSPIPGLRSLLWAVASAGVASCDWDAALVSLEELDISSSSTFPMALPSPFQADASIRGEEIRRLHCLVLLQIDRASEALGLCMQVCAPFILYSVFWGELTPW